MYRICIIGYRILSVLCNREVNMDDIYARLDNLNAIEDEIIEPSEIQDFFTGQSVFLTGCTGFLGKVFLEKLLRSCQNVKRVYVLVRPKNVPADVRIKQYFDDVIFNRLKVEHPNFQSTISIIEGDLFVENLGLSAEDKATLVKETTLMYHNASNVKFEEKINVSIRVNVFGTKYMLDLAKECKNLLAFVYISTAYSHCYQQHIEEKFYRPPGDLKMMKEVMELGDSRPDGVTNEELKRILGKWKNAYVFTKSTAESLVEECAKDVSFTCIVFRPSMVISTFLEPIRSWCGNINGPVGMMIGNGLGFVHALYKGNIPLDCIPADMCANAMISTTWDAVVNNKELEKTGIVYNFGSSVVNKITMDALQEECFSRGSDAPSVNMMGPYYTTKTNCLWYFWFLQTTAPLITALVADFVLLCRGKKKQVLAAWILMMKNMNALTFFGAGNWRIHVHRTQTVWDRMSRQDSKLFFCDLRKLDWTEYAYSFWAGLRVYILKDPMTTMQAGSKLRKTIELPFAMLTYVFRILFLFYVGRWLLNRLFSTLL